jgi:hypothetical protein
MKEVHSVLVVLTIEVTKSLYFISVSFAYFEEFCMNLTHFLWILSRICLFVHNFLCSCMYLCSYESMYLCMHECVYLKCINKCVYVCFSQNLCGIFTAAENPNFWKIFVFHVSLSVTGEYILADEYSMHYISLAEIYMSLAIFRSLVPEHVLRSQAGFWMPQ